MIQAFPCYEVPNGGVEGGGLGEVVSDVNLSQLSI